MKTSISSMRYSDSITRGRPMIDEAIGYLRSSENATRTALLGGVLTLFAFLIVPLFAVAGYLVRVLDGTASGDDEPPVFEDWGELIIEGARASAIAFVYTMIPAILGLPSWSAAASSIRAPASRSPRSV